MTENKSKNKGGGFCNGSQVEELLYELVKKIIMKIGKDPVWRNKMRSVCDKYEEMENNGEK
jgi:hypothetical protein